MTYEEKLKDSRWQERRRQILELDKFKCRKCKCRHALQVHHLGYISGADPWQYPDDLLITLCETCHSAEEFYKKEVKLLVDSMAISGISHQDIYKHLKGMQGGVDG